MTGIGALISFFLGWLAAQMIKTGIFLAKKKKSVKELFSCFFKMGDGGMPSGHTSSLAAMTTFIGFNEGFNSLWFATMLAFLIIVVHDSLNLRYAVGEYGEAINEIGEKTKSLNSLVKVVYGHRLIEVVVGFVLGGIMGGVCYLFFINCL